MPKNHREMAELLMSKLNDEELDALTDILSDRHQLLLHALGTYSARPVVSRTMTPRRVVG
jgi:hypothetical protein